MKMRFDCGLSRDYLHPGQGAGVGKFRTAIFSNACFYAFEWHMKPESRFPTLTEVFL